MALQGFTYC